MPNLQILGGHTNALPTLLTQINLSEPTKENIGTFNIDKFKKVVNSIFGKNSENALLEIEYATNREIYLKDAGEKRSHNAENLIPNDEPYEDAILRRAKELQGANNVKPNINRNKNNGGTTKSDLSGDGTNRKDIFSNTKRTENNGSSKAISRGNETGQKSTSEQPVGLKFLREQPEEIKFDSMVKHHTLQTITIPKYIC